MDKKERLIQLMDQISAISEIESEGAQRLLYSEKWLEAQQTLRRIFESAGLQPHFDAVGNLFGKVEGSAIPEETITSGSHIDTVIDGGRFDGQLGIICAFVAIEDLLKHYGQPKKSLQVLSLAEEEGSRFPYAFWGSKKSSRQR